MKKPLICSPRQSHSESGITIALVAVAMVAIIGVAVLSIDLVTLYLAKEEAQRTADSAALAAARVLSLSGITGDPSNETSHWGAICGPGGVAEKEAQAVATQNAIGTLTAPTVTVTYSAGTNGTVGAGTSDCTTLSASAFGVNPLITVHVSQAGLPNFFSRFWERSGNTITATATAEAFNSSNSDSGNQTTGTIIPVQPRCVKPWVVPNLDPLNPAGCTNNCTGFVDRTSGTIQHPGISLNGTGGTGLIGEKFWLVSDCFHGDPNYCNLLSDSGGNTVQPQANYNDGSGYQEGPPNILGVPGQVGTPVTAVPSCSSGDPYEEAVEGCDSPTNYQCGVQNANAVDLRRHNPGVNSITNAVECLIHQTDATNITSSSGQDYLSTTGTFGAPSSYPFQILAGTGNPLAGSLAHKPITSSNSIVSIPIYDQVATPTIASNAVTTLTFIGFLQVFVNAVDANGNRLITVLNVSGCGNGTNTTGNPVTGTSPVPIRLITPP